MENKRNPQCSCGSKLRCLEIINGRAYVLCVGVDCDKKWIAKRSMDKNLMIFKDAKQEFHG